MDIKKKIVRIIGRLITTITTFMIWVNCRVAIVLAGNLNNDKVVTGTKSLLNDATTAVKAIGGTAAALAAVYFFIRKSAADEQDQKTWNRRIMIAVISAVGIIVIGTLIQTVIKYYE